MGKNTSNRRTIPEYDYITAIGYSLSGQPMETFQNLTQWGKTLPEIIHSLIKNHDPEPTKKELERQLQNFHRQPGEPIRKTVTRFHELWEQKRLHFVSMAQTEGQRNQRSQHTQCLDTRQTTITDAHNTTIPHRTTSQLENAHWLDGIHRKTSTGIIQIKMMNKRTQQNPSRSLYKPYTYTSPKD